MTTEEKAKRNIAIFYVMRVLTKRVYLPIAGVYFVNQAGLSAADLGIVGAIIATTRLLSEVPTGYFSDKVSRSKSYVVGGLLTALAAAMIVLVQNKTGIFIAIAIESLGYAFLSGTGQALVHDALSALGREKEYTKVSSRAQSMSLFVNAGLVASISLTYAIDPRLPFVFGVAQYLLMAALGMFMHDIGEKNTSKKRPKFDTQWLAKHKPFLVFAFIFGIYGAVYIAPVNLKQVALQEFGFRPELLGWLYSGTSLIAAVAGMHLHKLKALGLGKYMTLDALAAISGFIGFWFGNVWIAIAVVVFNTAFWRYRHIVYEDHLLHTYPSKYKATMISTIFNMMELHHIWTAALLGFMVSASGYQDGFAMFGVLTAVVFTPLFITATAKALD